MFSSGIQHIAETPTGMAAQKDFVKDYMRMLPETWDDLKFIDGFPGKYVVLARRKGKSWYIAGINGQNQARTLTIKTPFIKNELKGVIITDLDNGKEFTKDEINFSEPLTVKMLPYGGFVIKTK